MKKIYYVAPLLITFQLLSFKIFAGVGGLPQTKSDQYYNSVLALVIDQGDPDNLAGLEICSATFITKQTLITAAHCVQHAVGPNKTQNISLYQFTDLNRYFHKAGHRPRYQISEKQIRIPDEYIKNFQLLDYDIALITLNSAYENAEPITLNDSVDETTFNLYQTIGYGSNFSGGGIGVMQKYIFNQPLTSASNSQGEVSNYLYEFPLTDELTLCRGDSGSPVIDESSSEPKLIGIISYVKALKKSGQPLNCGITAGLVSTRKQLNWIKNNMK